MSGAIDKKFVTARGVRKDWVDLRDQLFVPGLSILLDSVSLDHKLTDPIPGTDLRQPIFGVRNQKHTQRCVGYSLAALIDIQRCLQLLRRPDGQTKLEQKRDTLRTDIASADMLYRMAYFHDRYPDNNEQQEVAGIRSLRSAIKGFYHHGACLDWPMDTQATEESRWQSTSYFPQSKDNQTYYPSVAQAKKAREIGLGAYFRLASSLNHYHSALNQAEAVLVSTQIHDGWLNVTAANGGIIPWPPKEGLIGYHAVVLTGYDSNGFHVLNSWGSDWGGYRGQAGIALWSYADWAKNIIDAWVLRLGVPAPKAFDVSIGEQGLNRLYQPIQSGSTPCFELVGHFMHLDDGLHVSTGSYPSFPSGWAKTCAYLKDTLKSKRKKLAKSEQPYKGVLVWIPSSLEGIKPAFDAAVSRKRAIKDLELYPYSVFWCNSFAETSLEVFDVLFDDCAQQAGERAQHLDALIEERVRGIGRAFWREIETSAKKTLRGPTEHPTEPPQTDDDWPGYVTCFLRDLIALKDQTQCEIHLVCEGAGALVVHEMLLLIAEDKKRPAKRQLLSNHDATTLFDTLHLVHPVIGLRRASRYLTPCLEAMNGEQTGKDRSPSRSQTPIVTPRVDLSDKQLSGIRGRIYVPAPSLEKTLHFGRYSKPLLHLVAHAFEDPNYVLSETGTVQRGQHRDFLGAADIAGNRDFPAQSAIFQLNRISKQSESGDPVTQSDLMRDPTITESIFKTIRDRRK
ncbi:C1 family peptidase [Ruegeria sp. HKCCC2117]|uniref:C1 family peptidase n=1 Tax=Ruegeria sp. HKCCC2117 TaxID=2682992 RepID=UPI00148945DD|nr:C1 family peptidase [Ruegeria sp. HKCCC2117]